MNIRNLLAGAALAAITLSGTIASAYGVRVYNSNDGKVYSAEFHCKNGRKTTTEVRKGTTTISTHADGACDFKLNGHTLTINKGDSIVIKNGKPSKK